MKATPWEYGPEDPFYLRALEQLEVQAWCEGVGVWCEHRQGYALFTREFMEQAVVPGIEGLFDWLARCGPLTYSLITPRTTYTVEVVWRSPASLGMQPTWIFLHQDDGALKVSWGPAG